MEKKYEKQKTNDLDRELENLKRNNEIAKSRNEDLLRTLQSNMFSNYQKPKITSHSQSLLTREKTNILIILLIRFRT